MDQYVLVTSLLGFNSSMKAISGYRERLPPQSILRLSPLFYYYSDLRIMSSKFLKNWKKINAKAIPRNATSRAMLNHKLEFGLFPKRYESLIRR